MKRFSRGERIWVAGLLILALLLGIKSWWLDPWDPRDSREEAWLAAARQALGNEPDTWLRSRGVMTERIVGIKEMPSDKAGDPPVLKVTVRSYIAGYLPFGDRKLTIPAMDPVNR